MCISCVAAFSVAVPLSNKTVQMDLRGGSRKLNEGGSGMNAMRTCLRMRRYPCIISSAQHTAAPPAHRIAKKAHMSRRKSENDVFKCILMTDIIR